MWPNLFININKIENVMLAIINSSAKLIGCIYGIYCNKEISAFLSETGSMQFKDQRFLPCLSLHLLISSSKEGVELKFLNLTCRIFNQFIYLFQSDHFL